MNKFLRENWFKIGCFTIAVIFFGFWVFWYALRPYWIKKGCSLIKEHSDAIVAQDASPDWPGCNSGSALDQYFNQKKGFWDSLNNIKSCHGPKQAEPAKDWFEPASNSDYALCLRQHGI